MDSATIIGLIGGTFLVLLSVLLGGSALMFFNVPGLLIVLGGTLATCFIKFSMKDVINSIKVVMKAFLVKLERPESVIEEMVKYTRIAKKEGLIALESETPSDKFSAKALQYLSDGYDEGLIEDMLSKDIQLMAQRHTVGQNVFKGMGDSAPAFGMIGTLIGLVQMLANMSEPKNIGPAMAVALLTTLYGALIANLVCLPLADKLALRSQQEQVNKNIVLEAAIGISKGIAPLVLEESLMIYLSPVVRDRVGMKRQEANA
jgi:chemotaxis protein MotA